MTGRLRTIPVGVRSWLAAALCVVPLGLVWTRTAGSVTPGITGPPICNADGFCEPGIYTPGSYVPGSSVLGAQSPARILLLLAVAALVFTATRRRTAATLRLVRLATAAVAGALVLAAADRAPLVLCCLGAALVLLVPSVRVRLETVVLESGPLTR